MEENYHCINIRRNVQSIVNGLYIQAQNREEHLVNLLLKKVKNGEFPDIAEDSITLLKDRSMPAGKKLEKILNLKKYTKSKDPSLSIDEDSFFVTDKQTGERKEFSLKKEFLEDDLGYDARNLKKDYYKNLKKGRLDKAWGFVWERYGHIATIHTLERGFGDDIKMVLPVYGRTKSIESTSIPRNHDNHYDYVLELKYIEKKDDETEYGLVDNVYIDHKSKLSPSFHIADAYDEIDYNIDPRTVHEMIEYIYDSILKKGRKKEWDNTLIDLAGIAVLQDKLLGKIATGYFPVFQSSKETMASSTLLDSLLKRSGYLYVKDKEKMSKKHNYRKEAEEIAKSIGKLYETDTLKKDYNIEESDDSRTYYKEEYLIDEITYEITENLTKRGVSLWYSKGKMK